MKLLQCTQHQTCGRCHATNITELKHAAVAVHTIPNMQVLLLNQYHSAKARHCCHAIQSISLTQSMQLLPCIQYQICSCCYATNITQLKHAAIAMHTQYQTCSRCHATNIAELKYATVAMHTIPNMNCCYATNITQVKHAAVAMRTIPHMQSLPCKQCHTVYIRILDMYIIMFPSHNCNSKFSWSNICNFYKINQNQRLFHHETLLMAFLSIDRA